VKFCRLYLAGGILICVTKINVHKILKKGQKWYQNVYKKTKTDIKTTTFSLVIASNRV